MSRVDQLEALARRSYRAVRVLHNILWRHDLGLGASRARELLDDIEDAMPELASETRSRMESPDGKANKSTR